MLARTYLPSISVHSDIWSVLERVGIVGDIVGEGPWSGAGAGPVGGRSSKEAGKTAVGGMRETRQRQGATCRAVCR